MGNLRLEVIKMADDLINALLERYGQPSPGGDRHPDIGNALAQASTADVMAQYQPPARTWGGIKSYLPDQPGWMKTAQGYVGRGLAAFPPEAMLALNFLGRAQVGPPKVEVSSPAAQLPSGVAISKSPKAGMNGETFYDILHDGQLAGYLKVHPDNTVGNIWVDPSLRRRGIASAAYDQAAKDRGVATLGAGDYHTGEGRALRDAYEARNSLGRQQDNVPSPNWQDTARLRDARDPDWTRYGYPISDFPPSRWRGSNDQ